MARVLAIAALLAVLACAYAQTRPNIPATFLAASEIELHEHDHTRFGEGFFASDETGRRQAERYDFHEERYHVFHLLSLQRWDLAKEYLLSSEDPHHCRTQGLSGTFESPFGWVSQAHFAGNHTVHGVVLDAWEARFSSVRLLVAVHPDAPNVPVAFERESTSEYTRYYFREFNATRPSAQFFNVPQECQQAAAAVSAPTRPQIATSFLSEIEVEFHDDGHNKTSFGEGFWAHNQRDGRAAERYDFHDGLHVLHILNLERYDLHRFYSLNSEDIHDCQERDLHGDAVAPFEWVNNATYIGEHMVHNVALDAWEARFGGVRLLLGVSKDAPNVPVAFERETAHDFTRYYFRHFDATIPDDRYFEVPEECHHH